MQLFIKHITPETYLVGTAHPTGLEVPSCPYIMTGFSGSLPFIRGGLGWGKGLRLSLIYLRVPHFPRNCIDRLKQLSDLRPTAA
jgi:hypothetical protein